jgi:hypothetical protein
MEKEKNKKKAKSVKCTTFDKKQMSALNWKIYQEFVLDVKPKDKNK